MLFIQLPVTTFLQTHHCVM